jgi:L-methionine (R)-S-oxide reductase
MGVEQGETKLATTRDAKIRRYEDAAPAILAVVAGEPDIVARMATVAAMLAAAFEDFSWCGFYRVDPTNGQELVIGPYQGPLGCLRIAFGRGVCGAAAARRETVIVEDVHAFPDHIACDVSSRSEIVVPVFDASGVLLAVLDVDSRSQATFDPVDAKHLRALLDAVFAVSHA